MGGWFQQQASRIREAVLLERAQRAATEHPADRQARLQQLWQAARRRIAAARDLRYGRQGVAALTLYREAVALLVTATLVQQGEPPNDSVLDAPATWAELQRQREAGDLDGLAVDWDALADWLAAADPLATDRVARTGAHQAREAADALASWLTEQAEPRTAGEIRVARAMRVGGLGVGVAVLLGAAVAWAVAPSNVALGKPVMVSSQRRGTPDPAGVVDGRLGGTFGFHTNRQPGPWVEIDLEAPYALTQVVVYNRADGHFDDSLPLELSVAAPGGEFEPVARRTKRFTASRPWRVELNQRVAQRVRLAIPRRTFFALSEVEVYGKQP